MPELSDEDRAYIAGHLAYAPGQWQEVTLPPRAEPRPERYAFSQYLRDVGYGDDDVARILRMSKRGTGTTRYRASSAAQDPTGTASSAWCGGLET